MIVHSPQPGGFPRVVEICSGDIIVGEIRQFKQKQNGTLTPEYQMCRSRWRERELRAWRESVLSGIIMESFCVICVGAEAASCALSVPCGQGSGLRTLRKGSTLVDGPFSSGSAVSC